MKEIWCFSDPVGLLGNASESCNSASRDEIPGGLQRQETGFLTLVELQCISVRNAGKSLYKCTEEE